MKNTTPLIGAALYQRLAELTALARDEARTGPRATRYHAAGLCIVLESLLAQSADLGTHVSVHLAPIGGGQ
jgi:hypothetical protein